MGKKKDFIVIGHNNNNGNPNVIVTGFSWETGMWVNLPSPNVECVRLLLILGKVRYYL